MKSLKSFLSILLVAVLLVFAAVPTGAQSTSITSPGSASGFPIGENEEVLSTGGNTIDSAAGAVEDGKAIELSHTKAASANGSYYDQLSTRAKAFYKAMKGTTLNQLIAAKSDNEGYHYIDFGITGVTGQELPGYAVGSTFYYTEAGQAMEDAIYADLYAAVAAIRYDLPEVFWTSSMISSYDYKINSATMKLKITSFSLGFKLSFNGNESYIYRASTENARIIADAASNKSTTLEKVQLAHDIINHISSYSTITDADDSLYPFEAFSALVPGDAYEPVCEGYSKAMKMVCDLLDIPCILVISDSHMWNNIKMDDGNWYIADLTWDDGNRNPFEYFLIGEDTVVGGIPFNQESTHQEIDIYSAMIADGDYDISFAYPVRSKTAYSTSGYKLSEGLDELSAELEIAFRDVARSQWYYDAVQYVYDVGLFSGTSDGIFSPNADMDRAMFVKVLSNKTENYEAVADGAIFRDVPAEQWYYECVQWAATNGIVGGYEDGRFNPKGKITREQMAVMLYNYAKKTGTDITVTGNRHESFTDFDKVASWAKEAVIWAVDKGIINGVTDTTLQPKSTAKRSQVAQIFKNADEILNDTLIPEAPEEETPEVEEPGEAEPEVSEVTEP